jgi:predicted adenylyl cyclase CyaB
MIEFELKFKITTPPSKLSDFQIIGKSTGEDLYYDASDYRLFKGGNFLRVRNGKRIDFKLNVGDTDHLYCKETNFLAADVNSSNKDFIELTESLHLKSDKYFADFKEFIENNGLILLSPIIKKRIEYKIDDTTTVTIDDVDDLGTFMEAEMMFDDEHIISKHTLRKELIDKLKKSGIYEDDYEAVGVGYVELYLLKNNRSVYELGRYKI